VDGCCRRPPTIYSAKEDTEPNKLGDESESSDAETTGTEEASSVRESLAEKQQSDPEFGLLVKLRLQSVQRPSIDQLITEEPKTEASGSVDQTKEAEVIFDTENDTQDERTPKRQTPKQITRERHDWNKMAGPSSADYVVDDAE